ncbi:tripartite tricarboxylate transporter substrate binding protein [Piscinibacter sakaiensis]|uniref:Putative exported protein n=1 Tax=Piscinibacter sakaiensis TaxID=1547922 RepID=A0A0K8P6A4_PISS1|nr:tripartite tricarboxylate transporter substrate binding protein [Piscinibacter sakaiensis]GAP38132.1 putative exported protein [Piscinibacter sakaiensis]
MDANRRRTLVLSAGLPASLWLPTARAQAYPSKPVRIVVPFTPGSVLDVLARLYADRLQPALGQPVIVDNKPGANQLIGVRSVTTSPADGYTVLLSTTELVRAPLTYPNAKFDPMTEFTPIARVGSTSIFFVVPASSPAHTLQEFVELSRKAPGGLNWGSLGQGSGPHFYGELIASQTGAKMNHVPYKGEVPMLPDLFDGRLAAGWVSGLPAAQYTKEGKLRALGAGSVKKRVASLPQVPTLAELGIAGTDVEGFIGYFVAAGTPPAAVKRLSTEMDRIASLPEMRERMLSFGFEPQFGGTPESFRAAMQDVHDGWSRVNKMVKIVID